MEITLIDVAIISLYFILLAIVAYFAKKKIRGLTDYFLAGRRLTLPIFIATLVSTWYGGILGVGQYSYFSGLGNWLTQGIFYYIMALLFALFLAHKIRKSNLFTIPDQLEKFYDKKSRFLGSIFNFILVTPAPYILSLGVIFMFLFGVPKWIGIVIVLAILIAYTLYSGFYGVIYTDFLQFIFMMVGVALVVPFAIAKYGGFEFLTANLPETHLHITGGLTTQMILVWGFIAFWTFVDPGFYQRCYAAKDSKIPRKGILISIGFWILFDICTTFTGMYAFAANKAGHISIEILENGLPQPEVYMIFANSVLPPVIMGVFLIGIIATLMSTIDSFTLLGAMNISHDIYKNTFKPDATDKQVMKVTKIGIVITASFGATLALFFSGIISMWYTIGTVCISTLIVPVLGGFFIKTKKPPISGVLSMIAGAGVSTVWMINGYSNLSWGWPVYWFEIEPMYPGILAALLVYLFIIGTSKIYKYKGVV